MATTAHISYRPEGKAPSIRSLWLGVFLAAAVLYAATCQRGISWQDSGMFQWRVATADYVGELGLALAHPLYIAAGRAITQLPGSNAYWLNFFSGLGSAVALANLACLLTYLTHKRWIGAAAAAMLAVAHSLWWLSTIAEVYTWTIAGLTLEVWLLVLLIERPSGRKLLALGLVNGLGLAVHNFALLPLPVYVAVTVWLVMKRRLAVRWLVLAVLAWAAGAGVYIGQIIHLAYQPGYNLFYAVSSALVGEYSEQVLNLAGLSKYWKVNVVLGSLSFVNFLLPLAVVGWWRLRRWLDRPATAAIAAITVIHAVFFLRYPVPDQFTFMLPTLTMVALAAGLGVATLARRSRRWRTAAVAACVLSVAGPPIFYAVAPQAADAVGVEAAGQARHPYRDEMRYWIVPWKHNERSAARFAREAVDTAARTGGVIWADSTPGWALAMEVQRRGVENLEIQLYGRPLPQYLPPEPELRDDTEAVTRSKREFRDALGDRELYVISPEKAPKGLAQDAELEPLPEAPLYRVRWRGQPANPSR
ncbi:MAG: protein O-mannosyl-transferase family [Phycisphaerae bacterium]